MSENQNTLSQLAAFLAVENLDQTIAEIQTDSKARIVLPNGRVTVSAAAEKVAEAASLRKDIFSRGDKIWETKQGDDGRIYLSELTPAASITRFEKSCVFLKSDKNGHFEPTVLPELRAKSFLESQELLNGLPRIRGIINCPFVYLGEGSPRVITRGYDSEAKMLVTGGDERVNCNMSREVSVNLIENYIFKDYLFATESDKARAIAMLLTPAFKLAGIIKDLCPLDFGEAMESQSGKTFRCEQKAAIYNEWSEFATQRKRGTGGNSESFATAVSRGHPFIVIDNVRDTYDSSELESFLTNRAEFTARILYRTQRVNPSSFFVSMTSNGVKISRDLANRSCYVRILKQPPDYQFQDLGGDPIDHFRENHFIYLSAILSIVRLYDEAGQPTTQESRHNFRDWARRMDWIVQNYFGLPPLLDGHEEIEKRSSNADAVFVREICRQIGEQKILGEPTSEGETVKKSASAIARIAKEANIPIPGFEEKSADDDEKAAALALGRALRRFFDEYGTPIDGHAFDRRSELEEWVIERYIELIEREGTEAGEYEKKFYYFSRARV